MSLVYYFKGAMSKLGISGYQRMEYLEDGFLELDLFAMKRFAFLLDEEHNSAIL